ncbi:MAG: chorismate mutase [Candidatus Dormiibacter spiritus]|nr:MAG: chorismate mutase [Candidatus Dormibacteraeota bacterium]
MPVRGIRGATTAEANEPEAIARVSQELLEQLTAVNQIDPEEIAFAYFTTTPDLDAEFPAVGARRLGWVDVPLLCGRELAVPPSNARSVPRCIRVVLLYNTDRRQREFRHVYLRGAQAIKRELDRYRSQREGNAE